MMASRRLMVLNLDALLRLGRHPSGTEHVKSRYKDSEKCALLSCIGKLVLHSNHCGIVFQHRTTESASSYIKSNPRHTAKMDQMIAVHDIHEPNTGTWQYVVADPSTMSAAIIDSVLDFDPASASISTKSADGLLAVIKDKGYKVDLILETHAHADHLTAAAYLQDQLEKSQGSRPEIGIGKRIAEVQKRFGDRYGVNKDAYENAFDRLFEDDGEFKIGNMNATVLYLPGHTPDHVGYKIQGRSQLGLEALPTANS